MDDLRTQHAAWCRSLQEAVQADAWGQVLEAVEAYERLAEVLEQALPLCYELSDDQKRTLEKTARSVELRAKSLSSVDGERDAPTKEDMDHILDVLRALLSSESPAVFPLDLSGAKSGAGAKSSTVQVVEADDQELLDDYAAEDATGKTAPTRAKGGTYLDIDVSRVGLKDATVYVNPTIVVSVYDRDGKRLEEPKETPVGACDEPQHVGFRKAKVHLETSVREMEERGASVFFEVYHYKAKKRKKSCRCWALLELDELGASAASDASSADGKSLALELYQKPMDPKRKRIHLFTVKELYLHVQVRIVAT